MSNVYANAYFTDTPEFVLIGPALGVGKFLDMAFFRTLRDAVATIRAVSFFLGPIVAGGVLLGYLVATYVDSKTVLVTIAVVSLFMIVGIASGFWYYIQKICDP